LVADTNLEVLVSEKAKVSEARRIIRVLFSRVLVLIGIIIILITVVAAIFAPWLTPYDPYLPDLSSVLQQPGSHHWFGTDPLGRDTLSRMLFGARTSLIVGISAVCVAAIVGMTLGLVAGYYRGWIYIIIMRFTDTLMSFPMILLALAIAALSGGGLKNIVIALSIGLVASYTRLMCGQVLSIQENDYIKAEKALGASDLRIMSKHILPNCFPPLIVFVTLMTGSTILAEASLSFLGVGIMPPGASWGGMVNDGYRYLLTLPLLSFIPGIAIMLIVFAFNMVGDGLRDALDPRLRGTV
jgi:peptide/nickel transport system permease protein